VTGKGEQVHLSQMQLDDTIRDRVLKTFGEILSMEVELDPRITGTVTFELENTPVGQALDQICATANCEWKVDTAGKNPVLRFAAKPS